MEGTAATPKGGISMSRNDLTGELCVYSLHDKTLVFAETVKDNQLANNILDAIREAEAAAYKNAVNRIKGIANNIPDEY